jgi:hypothetical protein
MKSLKALVFVITALLFSSGLAFGQTWINTNIQQPGHADDQTVCRSGGVLVSIGTCGLVGGTGWTTITPAIAYTETPGAATAQETMALRAEIDLLRSQLYELQIKVSALENASQTEPGAQETGDNDNGQAESQYSFPWSQAAPLVCAFPGGVGALPALSLGTVYFNPPLNSGRHRKHKAK